MCIVICIGIRWWEDGRGNFKVEEVGFFVDVYFESDGSICWDVGNCMGWEGYVLGRGC